MLAIAALAAAAVACVLTFTDVTRRLELTTVDTRFEVRGEQPVRDDIVLVAIDDKTFDRDEYGSAFPFTRNYHADVIEQVSRGEPRLIVYDVQFTEPSGVIREVWVDDAGRVLKVAIPSRNIVALRDDPPAA